MRCGCFIKCHYADSRTEKVTHNNWFDAGCEQATISKNDAYKQRNNEITLGKQWRNTEMPEKEKKRVHKRKRKIRIEYELEELERLRSNYESKCFYRKICRRRKDFQPRTILCRDKEGMLLSKEGDILRSWAEHFDGLLNTKLSNQNATSQEIYQADLATDEPTPSLDDVENAIQKLKDNEVQNIDLIQAELIKNVSTEFVQRMYQLITKIWTTEIIPEDWS
jgi:hypothetical protein